jgi:hypothetical protein
MLSQYRFKSLQLQRGFVLVVVVMAVAGTDGLSMLTDAGLWAEMVIILHFSPHVFEKSKTFEMLPSGLPCGPERTPFPYYQVRKRRFRHCHKYSDTILF